MEYFTIIGSLIACILAVLKIFDLSRNRPILKKSGHGLYQFKDNSTEFSYHITFENVGRRPLLLRKMNVDLLDRKKKRLTIHSIVENIERKLGCPDIFEKGFKYTAPKKLPHETYFLRCKIFASGKNHILKIRIRFHDDVRDAVYEQIEKEKKKGLLDNF